MTASEVTTQIMVVARIPSIEDPSFEFFHDGAGAHLGFRLQRAWWRGEGPCGGIAERVCKELRPGDDHGFGAATLSSSDVGRGDGWRAWQVHLAASKRAVGRGEAA